ncbi:membrane protein [Allokutzneria multivorans]|uniref:Membrane protein n=1 Tax=Allokutzneria multivorans TaxID=1142134 RepID=A0ABP7U7L9_9PSEU
MAADKQTSAVVLAAFLGGMGVLHFVKPEPFDAIVPSRLPGSARLWTHLSGVAELGCAAAVAVPRTRGLGGLLTAGLFAAVFPANVKMAYDYRNKPAKQRLIAYARLPFQVPLVLWALRVRKRAHQ